MPAPVLNDWKEVYHRPVEDEPAAERFGGQQKLKQKAETTTIRRAGVQAVEACSTGQAPTLQTGTTCEVRDAEGQ